MTDRQADKRNTKTLISQGFSKWKIKNGKCTEQIANSKWQIESRKNLSPIQPFTYSTAFTLAEVLITLTIIGVLAALTIPTLINKATQTQTVTGVKKAYATLSGAYDSLVAEYGDIESANNKYGFPPYAIFSRMNISKSCEDHTPNDDCFPNVIYQTLKGDPYANGDFYNSGSVLRVTTDGMSWGADYGYPNCDYDRTDASHPSPLSNCCTWIYVDINGPNKGPAKLGRDLFEFYITSTGVYPVGAYYDIWDTTETTNCTTSDKGTGCAAKIIEEGAVNY